MTTKTNHLRVVAVVAAVALAAGLLVLFGTTNPAQAAFQGQNGKIAWSNFGAIYTMNADGSGQTPITDTSSDTTPAWSADGNKIAFASVRDSNFEIYVMDADGSKQTNISNNSAFDGTPSWSPYGNKIAFASNRDGNTEIYAMNADGSNPIPLTANSTGSFNPAWSPKLPDGSTKIAFQRDSEIYVMDLTHDANGDIQSVSTPVNLTNNTLGDEAPDWAPDGSKIAFSNNFQITVMDANGSNQAQLTNTPCCTVNILPAWSPDKTKIVFTQGDCCVSAVRVVDANGSNPQNLFETTPGGAAHPNWGVKDTTAPTVTGNTPTGTTEPRNTDVTVTFSEAMDPGSLTEDTIKLTNNRGRAVDATMSYNKENNTVTLNPFGTSRRELARNTTYTVTVEGGTSEALVVKDWSGNPLAADHSWTFTTGTTS